MTWRTEVAGFDRRAPDYEEIAIADVGLRSAADLREFTAALRASGREGRSPFYADGHALEIDAWEPWLRVRLEDITVVRLSPLVWGISGRR